MDMFVSGLIGFVLGMIVTYFMKRYIISTVDMGQKTKTYRMNTVTGESWKLRPADGITIMKESWIRIGEK